MRYFNRTENPNALVGIFLLILLAVFIGPNMLPRLASSVAPGVIDESIPCGWLRNAEGLAYHQSLIGRAAESPLSLAVRSSPVPTTADGRLIISIIIANNSLGTIPIVYNPTQVVIGDNGTSGIGLIFTPATGLTTGAARSDTASYPEQNIRLLGPRQRCVHRVEFPATQLDANIASGAAQVRAYYRINGAGQVQPNAVATPIYNDQGLDIVPSGYLESPPIAIPLAVQ